MSAIRTTSNLTHYAFPNLLRGQSSSTVRKAVSQSGDQVRLGGKVDIAKRGFIRQVWDGLVYGLKRTGAFFNYLGSQIKTGIFLFMGVFAFLPLNKGLRNWVEKMAIFPPLKIYDLPFKNADTLKAKIKEYNFSMFDVVKGKLNGLENDIKFDSKADNIQLRAWHIPAEKGQPTVLFHQQRNSNLSYLGPIMNSMRKKGYGIFVYDYPGYGKSQGKACEEAMYKAGLAASKKLASLKKVGVPVNRQIQMGYSLGTPVASHVSYYQKLQGDKPKALVLINSFPSLKKIMRYNLDHKFPWAKCLIGERAVNRVNTRLNCEDFLNKVDGVPTLFLQGENDSNAPFSLVEKMSEGMPHKGNLNQVELLPGTGHKLKDKDFEVVGEHFFRFMESRGLNQA